MVSIGQLKNTEQSQRLEQIRSLGTLSRMKLVHLASIALSKATKEVEKYTEVLHDLTYNLWSEAKRDEDVNAYLTCDQEMETSPSGYRYTPAGSRLADVAPKEWVYRVRVSGDKADDLVSAITAKAIKFDVIQGGE